MSNKDWSDVKITIGPPDMPDNERIQLPIHGEKDGDAERISTNTFRNAVVLLKDAAEISEYSRIILSSLSCELFLKAIIFKTKDEVVYGHDIYKLFFMLNQEEQNYLIDAFTMRTITSNTTVSDLEIDKIIDGFETDLAVNALVFETVRYKHEYSAIVYNSAFVYKFAVDLRNLAIILGFIE